MGAELVEAMSKAEVFAHRDRYVKDWKKNKAWKENEPEMARKTVTARLCRQLPMSAEFRQAMVADGVTPHELRSDLAGFVALEAGEEGFEDGEV
jgi:recombinational DNA repair protein RecT